MLELLISPGTATATIAAPGPVRKDRPFVVCGRKVIAMIRPKPDLSGGRMLCDRALAKCLGAGRWTGGKGGLVLMAPMVEMVGKVTRSRYDELVAESLDMVEEDTRCQFALGDAALELEPLRGHGGHLPLDEGDQGVEDT